MELLTLDSNYQPAELVERYASLLWTERYFSSGDFQLVTTDVERMMKLLPLEKPVTIRESTVPMLVEIHKIEKNTAGAPVLTVTGRSFESILERRASVKMGHDGAARVPWSENCYRPSDAAYRAIRQIIGDPVNRASTAPPITAYEPNDTLSMISMTLPVDYDEHDTETLTDYEIKPGNLYTTAMELMTTNHHALKAVRPAPGSNQISLEIYNGANLTDIVVFDAKFDQFEDATYLLSFTGSSNMAYVFSTTTSEVVNKNTPDIDHPEPSGLNRRVLYLDVSSEAGIDTHTRGLIELYKYNATALFDGKIAEQVVTGYNKDYFLGDIIRFDGEYGLSETVRVAEFIRSDDNTGSKAYPTFEVVT